MRNVMTLSAAALALVAAPAFAQDSNAAADVSAVDPVAAETAITRIQEAQQQIDTSITADEAAVDPAAANAAVTSIQDAQKQMDAKMGKKRAHNGDFFRLFSTLDADGDGSLTQEEIRNGAGSIVEAFDKNGDGAISQDDMGEKRNKGNWDKRPGADEADDGSASTDEPETLDEPIGEAEVIEEPVEETAQPDAT